MSTILEGTNTSEKIVMLLARNKAHKNDLAALLGFSVQTIYDRLDKNEWTNQEMEIIAKKWGIKPSDLM